MPKKMLKADYVKIVEEHFFKEGKKVSNLSKATIPKLKEIIEKYNIEYDEDEIDTNNKNLKIEAQKKKEEDEKAHAIRVKEWKDKINKHNELWDSFTEEEKEDVIKFVVIDKHRRYLKQYWYNKKENKKLELDTDKLEQKFKDEGKNVERKGKNQICVNGVNIQHGYYHEEWNEEKEKKNVENKMKDYYDTDIKGILDKIKNGCVYEDENM